MSESGKVEDLLDLLVDLANEPKSNSSSEELQESEPETKLQLVDKSEKVNLIEKLDQVEKIDEVNRIEKLDTREKITKDNNLSASPFWLTEKTSNNNHRDDRDDGVKALEQLHDLVGDLVRPEKRGHKVALRERLRQVEKQVHGLEHQIRDREQLIELLLPLIDQVIAKKSQQDLNAMSRALAGVIPSAITKQIKKSRDDIVDALYPVIGETIAKHMGEFIKEINAKIENTLSIEGIKRKIRSKKQGISEAELILRESIAFQIHAIFLIQKESGLVISQAQNQKFCQQPEVESDMVAGMLTAIRSFAKECSLQPENSSELTEIEYGNFKIIMEVAGYCYFAVAIEGEPTKAFILHLRDSLGELILDCSKIIQEFDGDPAIIPEKVHQLPQELIEYREKMEDKVSGNSKGLLILGFILLLFIGIPSGFSLYHSSIEKKVESALATTPELALYKLEAKVKKKKLILEGKLPNEYLRSIATKVATKVAHETGKLEIDNKIVAVVPITDPELITQEIGRLDKLFNQLDGIIIASSYSHESNRVTVQGTIKDADKTEQIASAFEAIPGVKSVRIVLKNQLFPIDERIYFSSGSASLNSVDIKRKILPIKQFLTQYPEIKLKIIGHTDPSGSEARNEKLARSRAETVKQSLETQGIAGSRLVVIGVGDSPPNVQGDSPLWLSRCVRFERIF